MHTQKVVVTGMGVVSAAGFGTQPLLHALKQGRSLVKRLPDAPEHGPCLAASIDEWSLADALSQLEDLPDPLFKLARRVAGRAPKALQLTTAAALEAWLSAELHQDTPDGSRTGLVVAGHNLTKGYSADLYEKFREKPEYLVASYGLNFLDTHHVGTLSELLGIQGEGFTVGGASGSGGVALVDAFRLVHHGYMDRCLVVGAPAILSAMEHWAFFQMGAMGGKTLGNRPSAACRPFDKGREGFVPGEGAAALLLESTRAAEARKAQPLARLASATRKLDGNRMTDPSQEGEMAVMRAALEQAGVAPERVAYINAHGTASTLGDQVEAAAITEVFGQMPWVNSTKSIVGHCLFAAGIVEAVATILQMRHGFLHGNANLDKPMEGAPRLVPAQGVSAAAPTALSNSFGFGGINASALFLQA